MKDLEECEALCNERDGKCGEDCVAIAAPWRWSNYSKFKWKDESCWDRFMFVCQKTIGPTYRSNDIMENIPG